MRTVAFSRILDGIAALLGEDALTEQDRKFVARTLDAIRVRQLWTHANWRELDELEQRFFADDYSAAKTYQHGDIVWYGGTRRYYAALKETTGNLPTDGGFWEPTHDYSRTVDFVQPGKIAIGTVNAMTLEDPRAYPNSGHVDFVRREGAAQAVGVGQKYVWVRFTRREPRLGGAAYNAATTYGKGAVVYDAATGQCYEAVAQSTGESVTDTDFWQLQELPYFGMSALTHAGIADLLRNKRRTDEAREHERLMLDRMNEAYFLQHGREGQVTRATVLTGAPHNQPDVNLVGDNDLTDESEDSLQVE